MPLQRQGSSLMSHLRVPVTAARAAAPEPGSLPATGTQQPIRHRLSSWPLTPPLDTEQSLPVAASPSRTDLKIAQIGSCRSLGELSRPRSDQIGGRGSFAWLTAGKADASRRITWRRLPCRPSRDGGLCLPVSTTPVTDQPSRPEPASRDWRSYRARSVLPN